MNDNSNPGLMTRIGGWLKLPFATNMDAEHWFLFLGLILVLLFLWSRIMHYIEEGVKEI